MSAVAGRGGGPWTGCQTGTGCPLRVPTPSSPFPQVEHRKAHPVRPRLSPSQTWWWRTPSTPGPGANRDGDGVGPLVAGIELRSESEFSISRGGWRICARLCTLAAYPQRLQHEGRQ